ncbi:MAG: hypothetical protein KJ667_06805, partial [Alphaproteobacteria bacterium]|nr:hypothetical protein [Alphaproteobacteria bacterium]
HEAIVDEARILAAQIPRQDGQSVPEYADAIRLFVNRHSEHKIDEEFYTYWYNVPLMMAMIKAHATVPSSTPAHPLPHMECATRSAVMYHILQEVDIQTRVVVIYPNENSTASHTFLEIYNPATKRWTIQDPDGNFYWRFKEGAQRAGVADLLRKPVHMTFTPCRDIHTCAYDDYADIITPYFAKAALINPTHAEVTLLVNPQRFPHKRLFAMIEHTPIYCALYEGGCQYKIRDVTTH